MNAAIRAESVGKSFGHFVALDDVSFALAAGQTLGVVGESGSGKSTLGKIVMRLLTPDAGRVVLGSDDLFALSPAQLRRARRRIQLVPQDPRTSLNPTMTVKANLEFQYAAQGIRRRSWHELTEGLLESVSLPADYMHAFPHELSGGQVQRIAIARAIAGEPDILVCDEAVSALDKSIQAQVLNTLSGLQAERGLALFFITHDLAVVEHMSDDVLVLNRGRVVEAGRAKEVLRNPRDSYTRELLAARTPLRSSS